MLDCSRTETNLSPHILSIYVCCKLAIIGEMQKAGWIKPIQTETLRHHHPTPKPAGGIPADKQRITTTNGTPARYR